MEIREAELFNRWWRAEACECYYELTGWMAKTQRQENVGFENDESVLKYITLIQIFPQTSKKQLGLLLVCTFLGWLMKGDKFFFEIDGG